MTFRRSLLKGHFVWTCASRARFEATLESISAGEEKRGRPRGGPTRQQQTERCVGRAHAKQNSIKWLICTYRFRKCCWRLLREITKFVEKAEKPVLIFCFLDSPRFICFFIFSSLLLDGSHCFWGAFKRCLVLSLITKRGRQIECFCRFLRKPLARRRLHTIHNSMGVALSVLHQTCYISVLFSSFLELLWDIFFIVLRLKKRHL